MTIQQAAEAARNIYRRMEDKTDHEAAVMYYEQIAANAGISYELWLLDHEGSEVAREGFKNFSDGMRGALR